MIYMLISVIIPSYNRANLIKETLDSIQNQTYLNWECIIVDDGSSDDTKGIVSQYCELDARFKLFDRPSDKKKGANACRNYGYYMSVGDYVMFMDADDLLSPYSLEERRQTILFNSKKNVWVFSTEIFHEDRNEDNSLFSIYLDRDRRYFLKEFLQYNLCWQTMAPIYSREIVDEHKFDEALTRLQDVDFHIRILLDTKTKVKRIDKVDNFYRVGVSNPFYKKKNYKILVAQNYFIIFKKISFLIKDDLDLKKSFSVFIKKMLLEFFYTEVRVLKKEIKYMIRTSYQLNIFSLNQYLTSYLFLLIEYYNLVEFKGIGIYYVRKYLKKLLSK